MEELSLFIDGNWKFGSGDSLRSYNPATGERIFFGKSAVEEDIDESVLAARKALHEWSNTPFDNRIHYLETFGKLLQQQTQQVAEIISKETGKPLWESKNEVASMIGKIGISIAAYHERCPEKAIDSPNGKLMTRHKPHGVVAVFGPFNFPGHLPNGHIIPALLAGNTVIFKPSELTPLEAKIIAELWQKAGIPPGVFNLIQGGPSTGRLLAAHPDINGLFFTGSYQTGQLLNQQLSESPQKILALEMGGNNPLVIWEATDLKAAAYLTIQSAYITSGQRCTCARRLILARKAPETADFLKILTAMIKSLKIGPYTDFPEPFMGSIITAAAAENLLATQKELISTGGSALIEMKLLKSGSGLISPGLIDVTGISKREDREIFGPLLQLIYVNSFEEAIEEANHTSYGLSAALFSDKKALYDQFHSEIHAGVINWNTPTTGSSSAVPFGGIGHSGNHRASAYYAADYCAYPVASLEAPELKLPTHAMPGVEI